MYKIINDESQLKFFFDNIMRPFSPLEAYFVSLAARNKYLTEEEQEQLHLGRSEMMSPTILNEYNFDKFLSKIKRFECNDKGSFLTKNNSYIPQKALSCYININPSDTLKALYEFRRITEEYYKEFLSSYTKGGHPDTSKLKSTNIMLLTSYQNNYSEKIWLDIDMDVDKGFFNNDNRKDFADYCKSQNLNTVYIIDTHSGFHVLIKVSELKFNPQDIVEFLTELYIANNTISASAKTEIIINKNMMIPLPGTFAGNYPITISRLD